MKFLMTLGKTALFCILLLSIHTIKSQENYTQKNISYIGLKNFPDSTRLFLKSDDKLNYKIIEREPRKTVIIVENANTKHKNNLNTLDYRYFDSPIYWVEFENFEGVNNFLKISIFLKKEAPFKVNTLERELSFDFQR